MTRRVYACVGACIASSVGIAASIPGPNGVARGDLGAGVGVGVAEGSVVAAGEERGAVVGCTVEDACGVGVVVVKLFAPVQPDIDKAAMTIKIIISRTYPLAIYLLAPQPPIFTIYP